MDMRRGKMELRGASGACPRALLWQILPLLPVVVLHIYIQKLYFSHCRVRLAHDRIGPEPPLSSRMSTSQLLA